MAGHGLACDLWSVGVMAFALVSGEFPWFSKNSDICGNMIKYSDLKFPQEVRVRRAGGEREVGGREGAEGRKLTEYKASLMSTSTFSSVARLLLLFFPSVTYEYAVLVTY